MQYKYIALWLVHYTAVHYNALAAVSAAVLYTNYSTSGTFELPMHSGTYSNNIQSYYLYYYYLPDSQLVIIMELNYCVHQGWPIKDFILQLAIFTMH